MPLPKPQPSRLWIALIILVTAIAHRGAVSGESVYRDSITVPHLELENTRVTESLRHALSVISKPEEPSTTGSWEPVPVLLRSLSPLFGEHQIRALHVLSLLAHIGAVLALMGFASSLGARPFSSRAAGLLFGLHPVGVQSSAWISALGAPLAALFALLALSLFVKSRRLERPSILAGALFALALLSSPLAVAALPVALYLRTADLRTAKLRTTPASIDTNSTHAGISLLFPLFAAMVTVWLLGSAAHGSLADGFLGITTHSRWTGLETVWTQIEVFQNALVVLILPTEQDLFRTLASVPNAFNPRLILFGVAVLIPVLSTRFKLLRFFGQSSRAIGLTALSLAPLALAAPWMATHPLSDDHLYLALALFALIPATLLAQLPRKLGATLLVLLALFYGTTSIRWTATWIDNTTLLEKASATAANSPHAQWTYAYALLDANRRYGQEADLRKAMAAIERSQDLLDLSKARGSTIVATPQDFLRTNLALGWCLLALVEIEDYNDFKTPHSVFEAILDSRPDNVEARIGLGICSRGLEDSEAAEAAYRAALTVDSDSVDARSELGSLMMMQDRWKEAQEQFERALIIRPNDMNDRVWLARSLLQQGWIERAEEQARLAHDLAPYHPEPQLLLGILELKRGNTSRALKWIDSALIGDPEDGFARLQRGYAFWARGEIQNAMVEFKRAADRMPESFEAFYSLGNSLLLMERPDVAAEQFGLAYELQASPETLDAFRGALAETYAGAPGVLFGLAGIDFQREDYDATRYWIDLVRTADPDHAGALHLSGLLYRAQDDPKLALGEFLTAARLLPDSFQVRHDLGYLLLELGRPLEAIPHLERALALVPPTPESPAAAAEVKKKIGASLAQIRGT